MRPLGVWALAGAVLAALGLAVLLNVGAFPSQTALIVVWLLPIAFGLHVFEEFGVPGGFVDWSARYRPRWAGAMTQAHLWRANAIGGAAALGVALATFDYAGGFSAFGPYVWLMLLFTLTENDLYHVRGTLESRRYSPGLVTSLLLYFPLTVVGIAVLVNIGAVGVVAVPVCAVLGIVLFPFILRESREHEGPIGGGRHAASAR
jgi:hypothetical protein